MSANQGLAAVLRVNAARLLLQAERAERGDPSPADKSNVHLIDAYRRGDLGRHAVCNECGQAMETAPTCLVDVGDMPYGHEAFWPNLDFEAAERCNGCGVELGGLHHAGCDTAECRGCGQQALACECVGGDEAAGVS
ncbi:MAG: hypothetical protein QOD92_3645 [Acidimicrobiaceae bacterium]|jgi:hypothetical protein